MKGNNSMELNEATMIEVVQFWLDNKMFRENAAPQVTAVKTSPDSGYTRLFKIETTDRAAS
jgi:hypothetical protein